MRKITLQVYLALIIVLGLFLSYKTWSITNLETGAQSLLFFTILGIVFLATFLFTLTRKI